MQVNLNNIGIIDDSTIELAGLTIITGHNNSGKTTVGKAMYAVVAAMEDFEAHALEDICSFVYSQVNAILRRLGMRGDGMEPQRMAEAYPYCNIFSRYPYKNSGKSLVIIKDVLTQVIREVQEMSLEDLKQMGAWDVLGDGRIREEEEIVFLKKKEEALNRLEQVKDTLQSDPEMLEYASARLNKTLLMEFNQQVLPMSRPDAVGDITVTGENGQLHYRMKIKNNNIVSGEKVYFSSAYENVIFLDDVYILDSLGSDYPYMMSRRSLRRSSEFSENILGQNHNQHLLMKLREEPENLFEELVFANNAKSVLDKINQAFPDDITIFNGRYVCADSKLDVRNLATGSKMFALIKMLLERGELNDRTLLILDEPESHLHPEWQNYFAEVIVLLIQHIHVDVLLTTHSPNFLLAMEMYAKKHKIWDKTNVYDTVRMENSNMVKYQNARESIRDVYAKLAIPLFAVQEELQRIEE